MTRAERTREYMRRYYLAHAEAIRARTHAWYWANRERALARGRAHHRRTYVPRKRSPRPVAAVRPAREPRKPLPRVRPERPYLGDWIAVPGTALYARRWG